MSPLNTVLAFEAFGARIGIRVPESVESDFTPRLPPRSRPIATADFDATYSVEQLRPGAASGDPQYRLVRDGVALRSSRDLAKILLTIESDLHFQVALAARDFLFVHAGVVRINGAAVVMPGRTETGKSSLVLALVRAGADYFSDEYAVVDPNGRVHAYPKPLLQRREGKGPRFHSLDSVGGRDDPPAVPLGLTVITRFREGSKWNPQPVSAAQAMLALFDNTVVARRRPAFALDVLAKAVAGTRGMQSDRGEATGMVADLLDRVVIP